MNNGTTQSLKSEINVDGTSTIDGVEVQGCAEVVKDFADKLLKSIAKREYHQVTVQQKAIQALLFLFALLVLFGGLMRLGFFVD